METCVELEAASRTHPGLIRPHNEDSVAVVPHTGLAILADGMGGYNAGEVAAAMATTLLRNDLETDLIEWGKELHGSPHRMEALMQARIARANTAIYEASLSQPQYAGMGTTLVVAAFVENHVTVAHLGDSRLYRLRNGEFLQITRDHSLLQEQLDAGLLTAEQAKLSQHKNLVTRALGVDLLVDPEIHDYETQADDIYLLCSDGLSDMVEDEEIGSIVERHGHDLDGAAEALIEAANRGGGRDNISAILVRIKNYRPAKAGKLTKFMEWLK